MLINSSFLIKAAAATSITALIIIGLNQYLKSKSSASASASASASSDIFSESDYQYLSKYCLPDSSLPPEQKQYGVWRSTQNCNLPAAKSRNNDTLPIDAIFYDKDNKVIGFKRMIVSPKRNQFYSDVVGSGVQQEKVSCVRFGSASTPLLTVVRKAYCDDLTYNFI